MNPSLMRHRPLFPAAPGVTSGRNTPLAAGGKMRFYFITIKISQRGFGAA
jgi:hypothetical protein